MDINYLHGNVVDHDPEPSAIIQDEASQSTSETTDLELSRRRDNLLQLIRLQLDQSPINVAVGIVFDALRDNLYRSLWSEICQLMVDRIGRIAQTSTMSEAFEIVIGISTNSFSSLHDQFRIAVCQWMLRMVIQMSPADFFRMGNATTILLHCLCDDDVRNGFRVEISQWMGQMNLEQLIVIERAIRLSLMQHNELRTMVAQRRSEIARQNPYQLSLEPTSGGCCKMLFKFK